MNPGVDRVWLPAVLHTLHPERFPATMELFRKTDPEGTDPVWSAKIDGPGVTEVPKSTWGPVWARVSFPDGKVEESGRPT